jgi:ribonuclease HI
MGKVIKQQYPVYFISEGLAGSKKYYLEVEKICYVVVMSARKLRHYFESHTIKVLINQLLNDIFDNRDNSGRISKWAMEHSMYVVDFEKHNAIKSQILADFITEWSELTSQTKDVVHELPWLVYCDGAWGSVRAKAATALISPFGIKICYVARLQFNNEADKCTNNITEYEAILLGLCKLRAIIIQTCLLQIDSKVVAGHIETKCIAREATLERYLALVLRMESYFKDFTVEYIERNKNTEDDNRAKATAHNTPMLADVFFQVIEEASVKTVVPDPRLISIIEGEDWHTLIMAYLHHYYEPDNTNEHIRMQQ